MAACFFTRQLNSHRQLILFQLFQNRVDNLEGQLDLLTQLATGRGTFGQQKLQQQTFDFLGGLVDEATTEIEQEIEDERSDDKPKRKPKRRKPDSIPDSVERERIELDVDPELRVCSGCQVEMGCIGEDVTSELEYIPARFVLKQELPTREQTLEARA